MKKTKPNIAIIGYGRFGRLLVQMLKPYGHFFIISRTRIRALARSQSLGEDCDRSRDKRSNRHSPLRETMSAREAKGIKQIQYQDLKKMDWIIPAVPISALESVLKKMKPCLKTDALVMDVCSVKVKPVAWMKKILPRNIEIIGTHPMFGPDSAKYGLAGLPIIICPIRVSEKTLRGVKNVFKSLKLKLIDSTPTNHDKEAAKSLALVHFIGRGLSRVNIKKQNISSLGFERLLSVNETVTNDTWQLFMDMHRYNPYAGKVRLDYINALENINKRLI